MADDRTIDTHLALAEGIKAWAKPDPELGWEGDPIAAEAAEEFAAYLLDGGYVDDALTDGSALITLERRRQVEFEGHTPEHDATHVASELAMAAATYAIPADARGMNSLSGTPLDWPWAAKDWKPSPDDRVRELVKAGALIAAEIDRLRRG